VLELARQLGNVSQACRVYVLRRDRRQLLSFQRTYDKGGAAALQEGSRRKPAPRNRVVPEIPATVVAVAIAGPVWAQVRSPMNRSGSG
jgi:hypothetical protein